MHNYKNYIKQNRHVIIIIVVTCNNVYNKVQLLTCKLYAMLLGVFSTKFIRFNFARVFVINFCVHNLGW